GLGAHRWLLHRRGADKAVREPHTRLRPRARDAAGGAPHALGVGRVGAWPHGAVGKRAISAVSSACTVASSVAPFTAMTKYMSPSSERFAMVGESENEPMPMSTPGMSRLTP